MMASSSISLNLPGTTSLAVAENREDVVKKHMLLVVPAVHHGAILGV